MSEIDVCNGDADGLCALVQYRLAHPANSALVTGLKREIELLCRVTAGKDDAIRVFDISMRRNRDALLALLNRGAQVTWFDHHDAGDIPDHPGLDVHIDPGADLCTSLIVDRYLEGRYRRWALVGAWGDNLLDIADALAAAAGLNASQTGRLRDLGTAINYNAYGETSADVHIEPAHLLPRMLAHADPLEFLESDPVGRELAALRAADLERAAGVSPVLDNERGAILLLPDEPWSRRVTGTLANQLAQASPGRAHAVLRQRQAGSWLVSVRAPMSAPAGADRLCRQFGGTGRARAAGIDRLAGAELTRFSAAFDSMRWG